MNPSSAAPLSTPGMMQMTSKEQVASKEQACKTAEPHPAVSTLARKAFNVATKLQQAPKQTVLEAALYAPPAPWSLAVMAKAYRVYKNKKEPTDYDPLTSFNACLAFNEARTAVIKPELVRISKNLLLYKKYNSLYEELMNERAVCRAAIDALKKNVTKLESDLKASSFSRLSEQGQEIFKEESLWHLNILLNFKNEKKTFEEGCYLYEIISKYVQEILQQPLTTGIIETITVTVAFSHTNLPKVTCNTTNTPLNAGSLPPDPSLERLLSQGNYGQTIYTVITRGQPQDRANSWKVVLEDMHALNEQRRSKLQALERKRSISEEIIKILTPCLTKKDLPFTAPLQSALIAKIKRIIERKTERIAEREAEFKKLNPEYLSNFIKTPTLANLIALKFKLKDVPKLIPAEAVTVLLPFIDEVGGIKATGRFWPALKNAKDLHYIAFDDAGDMESDMKTTSGQIDDENLWILPTGCDDDRADDWLYPTPSKNVVPGINIVTMQSIPSLTGPRLSLAYMRIHAIGCELLHLGNPEIIQKLLTQAYAKNLMTIAASQLK